MRRFHCTKSENDLHYGGKDQHPPGVPIDIRVGLNSGKMAVRPTSSDLHY
jgi:hypothetical protein